MAQDGRGRVQEPEDLARAKAVNSTYVSRILRLTLLAPDIVEAVLDGPQPVALTLPRLVEPFPVCWAEQGTVLGTPKRFGVRTGSLRDASAPESDHA